MDNKDEVYIDPFDEGYLAAKQGYIDVKILALPMQMMGDQLAYNYRDWRKFKLGALKALMEKE